jgi:hypothetical protein
MTMPVCDCPKCGHKLTMRCPSCSGRKGGRAKSEAKTAAARLNAGVMRRAKAQRAAVGEQGGVQVEVLDPEPDSREVGSCPACAGTLGGILRREDDGQVRCSACGHVAYCD